MQVSAQACRNGRKMTTHGCTFFRAATSAMRTQKAAGEATPELPETRGRPVRAVR